MSTDPRAAAVLAGLDPEQAAAVLAPLGPVRILAGAGTGKTRAITHRIAYQALTGQVDPRTVLAVTHSARAAGEMRDRIAALGVPGTQARTFHAAALRQLSYFWSATGLPGPRPELVSSVRGGRYSMLRGALAATLEVRSGDVDSTDVLDLDGEVTWARARRLTAAEYPAAARAAGRSRGLSAAVLGAAYDRYEKTKRANALLDFEDLLEQCAQLIESDADVAARIRGQYTAFVVDEYQDTDPAQQRLLDAWLGDRDAVTVVGDTFQCIYSFKGAEPSLIADFTTRYPHAVNVELVRDYRSTPQVVAAANRLMAKATGAYGLVLEGQQPDGPDPVVRRYDTEEDEERGVAARVKVLLAAGVPASEIAVLHRFNSQAVRLEAALQTAGVSVSVGDDAFFDRPEIRRAVTDLAAAAAHDPDKAGVAALRQVLTGSGFDPGTPPDGQGAARARWEAQAALLDLVEHLPGPDTGTAAALVTELRRRAADEHAPRRGAAVTVSTIHKAKGLEWDAVVLPRLTEGSLPSVFATGDAELAEERRLMYVALTRARRVLEVSCARERGDGGRRLESSRFLASVPAPSRTGRVSATGSGLGSGGSRPGRVFTGGQRVVHDSHGLGTVLTCAGGRVEVDFGGSVGVKKLNSSDQKLDTL